MMLWRLDHTHNSITLWKAAGTTLHTQSTGYVSVYKHAGFSKGVSCVELVCKASCAGSRDGPAHTGWHGGPCVFLRTESCTTLKP
jgi:hypothetical protein